MTPALVVIPACAAGAVLLLYGLPIAVKARQIRALRTRCARERALVLTYDDGPGPALTDEVLGVLAGAGARATFFMLGRAAERAPGLADRLVEGGHEAGCHSHAHLHAWKTALWRSLADAQRGFATLSRWLGGRAMYRPPYGKIALPTMAALWRRGSPLAWWTHDSGDTHASLPEPGRVVAAVEADGGGVVLLHDFDRDADRDERHAFVVETTRLLLDLAARRGLRVVTMSELMGNNLERGGER